MLLDNEVVDLYLWENEGLTKGLTLYLQVEKTCFMIGIGLTKVLTLYLQVEKTCFVAGTSRKDLRQLGKMRV